MAKKLRRESSQTESRCRDGKETSSKDSTDRGKEEDKAIPRSASEKHGGRGKDASSKYRGSSGSRRKLHSDMSKESGLSPETRRQRESTQEPMRHSRLL